MQNVVKHLAEADDEESCTPKRKTSKRARKANKEEGQQESEMGKVEAEESEKEPSILADFSACMFEYQDEETF